MVGRCVHVLDCHDVVIAASLHFLEFESNAPFIDSMFQELRIALQVKSLYKSHVGR